MPSEGAWLPAAPVICYNSVKAVRNERVQVSSRAANDGHGAVADLAVLVLQNVAGLAGRCRSRRLGNRRIVVVLNATVSRHSSISGVLGEGLLPLLDGLKECALDVIHAYPNDLLHRQL